MAVHDAIQILTIDMAKVTGECSQMQGHAHLAVVCSHYTYEKMMQPLEKELNVKVTDRRIHAASIMGSPVYFDDSKPEGVAIIFAHMCGSEVVWGYDRLVPYMVSVLWPIDEEWDLFEEE